MTNIIQQSIDTIRTLTLGVNPITGEKFADNAPLFNPQTMQALNTAIKSLEGRPKRIPKIAHNRPRNQFSPWDTSEENLLVHNFDCGKTFEELAIQHGRTELAIRARLVRLGKLVSRY